jgi:hypothetical protein
MERSDVRVLYSKYAAAASLSNTSSIQAFSRISPQPVEDGRKPLRLNPGYILRARVPDAVQRETKWSGAPLIRDRQTQSSLRRLRKLVCAP